jgi:hypothetical protein
MMVDQRPECVSTRKCDTRTEYSYVPCGRESERAVIDRFDPLMAG